jgi:putative phosphoesterase
MIKNEQTLIKSENENFEVTKIIGLISDTHVPKRAITVPSKVFELFKNVDFIIHAGDLVDISVIDDLEQIAPVLAVQGNMDSVDVKNMLPELNLLKVLDWKIGVMHDPDISSGSENMEKIAREKAFNVFVYGHTHIAKIKWEDKRLFINPGSPTDPATLGVDRSVGILKITKETIIPQIMTI